MTPKIGEIVIANLRQRSKKGLEFAKQILQGEKMEHPKLHEALEHYLAYWDDFTHPGLFSAACEAVGGDPDDFVPTQAAIAMMAAAFDIHDDIIDKSKVKHKIPTVYGKFGAEIALLLGNAFLIEGFTLFGKTLKELNQEKANIFEIIKQSLYEFGNAHTLELGLKKRTDLPPEEYLKIVKMKAASIEGDMRIGAIIGGGTDKEVESLARYGRILGILAMLREEFVDIFDSEELNQRVSIEYLPIPVLYAMQDMESRKKIEKLLAKKITNRDVDALVDIVFETKKVTEFKKYIEGLVAEAINMTLNVRNNSLREQFRQFASSTLEDL
jgi:geranylgeranyl diphosphate synthase type I